MNARERHRIDRDLADWYRIGRNREMIRFAARVAILIGIVVLVGWVEGITGGPTP